MLPRGNAVDEDLPVSRQQRTSRLERLMRDPMMHWLLQYRAASALRGPVPDSFDRLVATPAAAHMDSVCDFAENIEH